MSTATHRLPDWLGGLPVTLRQRSMVGRIASVEICDGEYAGTRLHLETKHLVETTPPEPDEGAYMVGEQLCVRIHRAASVTYRWFVPIPEREAGYTWLPWSEVWYRYGGAHVAIRRMVPATEEGPIPFPGDDLALRLPGGGWCALRYSLKLPVLRGKGGNHCLASAPDGLPLSHWCCSLGQTPHDWHIAKGGEDRVGVVWPARPKEM